MDKIRDSVGMTLKKRKRKGKGVVNKVKFVQPKLSMKDPSQDDLTTRNDKLHETIRTYPSLINFFCWERANERIIGGAL